MTEPDLRATPAPAEPLQSTADPTVTAPDERSATRGPRLARTPARLSPLLFLLLPACNVQQSALHPRGPHAEAVHTLTEVMTIGGGAIFLLVLVLAAAAILLPPRARRWMTGRGFVIGLGIAFPVVTLTALMGYGFVVSGALATAGPPALRVEVTGVKWFWRIRYLDADGAERLVDANEIHVPAGAPVEFVLKAEDVIHSFWVPALAGKRDMIPGRTNRIVFAAGAPGVYRGQCAEYCGDQHALMALTVVAHERADFEAWWAGSVGPAVEPATDEARRGAALFAENGCGACHAVRGTGAAGAIGPDLTRVGARRTIGAGSWPRNVGTLAGWVASAQHLKPGNAMPSYDRLSGAELRAVAAYLEGLK